MKRLAALITIGSLAACGQEAPVAEPETEVVQAEAPTTTFDGQPVDGVYVSTSSDGTVIKQDLRADGTYVNTGEGMEDVSGTYEHDSDNRICFTPDGGEETACYLPSDLQEDGSWTATREGDASETWTVKRIIG